MPQYKFKSRWNKIFTTFDCHYLTFLLWKTCHPNPILKFVLFGDAVQSEVVKFKNKFQRRRTLRCESIIGNYWGLFLQVLEFVDEHGNEVLNLGSFTLLPQHVVRLILSREELRADEFTKFQVSIEFCFSQKIVTVFVSIRNLIMHTSIMVRLILQA